MVSSQTPRVMRVSTARVLRAIAASTRVCVAPVTPNLVCGLHFDSRFSGRSRGWHVQTRLRSTAEDDTSDTSNAADTAHERALAAARLMQGTMASPSGTAFKETEVDRAKAQILRFLNYKPRTKRELFNKLVDDKLYDPEVADKAIAYLEEKEIVNDVNYAEQWARYKWRTGKWAPWRIRTSLREKGVCDSNSNEGLSRVFDDLGDVKLSKDAGDEDNTVTIAGEEENKGAELVRAARKRWVLTEGMDVTSRRRRLNAWLERRGHRSQTTRNIIDALEREDQQKKWDEEEDAARERGYRE